MPKNKRSTQKSRAIGRSLADRALRAQRAATLRRKRTLAALPRPKGAKAPSTTAGTLIAEGDSWFDYPLHDVLSELEDGHGYDVESVSHRGDTVEDMAFGQGQLSSLTRCIEKLLRRNIRPRAILLSGGGNDLAGDEFAVLLNHAASGATGLNESVVAGVIDQRLFDAYATILAAITQVCQGMIGATIPIVLHGYAYPVPDGRGVAGGWWFLPGPWLEPGFRRKGYAGLASRKAIMETLIDRFNAMLGRLAKGAGLRHVRVVELRDALSNGADYKRWWANELHPTPRGFTAVAQRFAAVIEE